MTTNEIISSLYNEDVMGEVTVPSNPKGLVVFIFSNESKLHTASGHSLAEKLRNRQFGTLLLNLPQSKINITDALVEFELQTQQLIKATENIINKAEYKGLNLVFLGICSGVASAIKASTTFTGPLKTIISLDGKPDLATDYLSKLTLPILLVVGGDDAIGIQSNQAIMWHIPTKAELEIVPGTLQLSTNAYKQEYLADSMVEWIETCFKV